MWWQIAIIVASVVFAYTNRPKIKSPRPPAFDEFDFPQCDEGTPIPVIFGDVWTHSWMVLGVGDYAAHKIKQGGQTIGYKYSFTTHMGLCLGEAYRVCDIHIGGVSVTRYPADTYPTVKDLYPGINGVLHVEDNRAPAPAGQIACDCFFIHDNIAPFPNVPDASWDDNYNDDFRDAALAALHGTPTPKFKGITSVVVSGVMAVLTTYPSPWAFRLRCRGTDQYGDGWYPGKAIITSGSWPENDISAYNPSHIFYQALTSTWGRCLDPSRLDINSYINAADTLYDEGFGLCLMWSRQTTLAEFMQSVLDHIGATQFVHRSTGLVTLRLIRDDYVVEELPVFSFSTGLLGIDEDSAGTLTAGTNELIVNYLDPLTNQTKSVRVKNLASIQAIGIASETVEYPGIPTQELALRVAQRDLRAKSGLAKRFKLRLDRRAYQIEPGGAFVIQAPEHGITQMVLRAARIEDGTHGQGTITITAVQDIFGLPATSYVSTQPPTWTPPSVLAVPIAEHKVMEAPYYLIAKDLDAGSLSLVGDTDCFVCSLALKPTPLSLYYDMQSRRGTAAFKYRFRSDFSDTVILASNLGKADITLIISGYQKSKISVAVGDALLIGDELMTVKTIPAGDYVTSITVNRGGADTVPALHTAGTRIWFFDDGSVGVEKTKYSISNTVDVRGITFTASSKLSASLATVESVTMGGRFNRPYPPRNFKIDGTSYPLVAAGTLAITWWYSNRIDEGDDIYLANRDLTNIPEVGTTYTVRILDAGDMTVLDTQTGLTDENTTWSGTYDAEIIIELWAVRDGVVSWQKHSHTLLYFVHTPLMTEDDIYISTENARFIVLES